MQIIINYLKKIFNSQIVLVSVILLLLLDSFLGIYLLNQKNEAGEMKEPLLVENDSLNENEEKSLKIKVDLKGAVAKPGVYEMANDTLLNDLINKADGFTAKADTSNISLVYKLKDGLVINIPNISTKQTQSSKKTTNKSSAKEITPENNEEDKDKNEESIIASDSDEISPESDKPDEKENSKEEPAISEEIKIININTASKEELVSLNGIGDAKAQAIIDYRKTTGLFATIEEIKNVKGIGEAIFAKIKDYITV